ncbi:MAG: T9SS type A sorting domain-containing protein [Pigmentiphaga sp.]|nr:T9SS type A sorting domain-containing protein [Pigmentiphaga sp.]
MKTITSKFSLLLTGFMLVFNVSFAEQLLLTYDFEDNSDEPSFLASGVESVGLGIKGSNITYTLEEQDSKGCMVMRTAATSGHNADHYVYIPITASAGKVILLSKTVVTHRRGNANLQNLRAMLYPNLESGTPSPQPNLIYKPSGGYGIGGSDYTWKNNELFMTNYNLNNETPFKIVGNSYAGLWMNAKAAGTGEWFVDEISFYGEIYADGELVVANDLNFGVNNKINTPNVLTLSVSGYNLADDVTVSIEGAGGVMFEIDKESITKAEAQSGVVVEVTYTPTTQALHEADLVFSYGEKEVIVKLSGAVPLIDETFDSKINDPFDMNAELTGDLDDYTVLPGWISTNVTKWHLAGNPVYSNAPMPRAEGGNPSYYTTPALDLSKPYRIDFVGKKYHDDYPGNAYIDVDGDLVFDFAFPGTGFNAYNVDGLVADENSKISFGAKLSEGQTIVVVFDNIKVANTFSPALSIPLLKNVQFDTINKNTSSTIQVPVKGYNLTSDLTVSLPATNEFELLSATTISKEDAETGTEISVKFNPAEEGLYTDFIQVSGGGLSGNSAVRTLNLIGECDFSSGINNEKLDAAKISLSDQTLSVTISGNAQLRLYNFSGMLLNQQEIIDTMQMQLVKGVYMVQLISSNQHITKKIIVK